MRVGETVTFRCRVYSGAQPVRLEWKVANSQHLPGNLHTVVLLNEFLCDYTHYSMSGLTNGRMIIILKKVVLNFR